MKEILLSGAVIPYAQVVEYNVGTSPTLAKLPFSDIINNLRNVQNGECCGLIVYNNSAMANSPTGATVVSDAVVRNTTITLANKNQEQFLQRVPLSLFLQSTQQYPLQFDPTEVDFSNSYIEQNAPGTVAPSANQSFVFLFLYRKK